MDVNGRTVVVTGGASGYTPRGLGAGTWREAFTGNAFERAEVEVPLYRTKLGAGTGVGGDRDGDDAGQEQNGRQQAFELRKRLFWVADRQLSLNGLASLLATSRADVASDGCCCPDLHSCTPTHPGELGHGRLCCDGAMV
ncbi:hypothetical protein [Streptomyces sp. NPDC057253]|uniref:hypothetical protein n=1 Tax=Streptomyces sp. NPDC057253 TaxID=3346069 RepID=UPI00363375FC